jgi:hypothetical protein
MDKKVADLSFDDQEQGTTACACILCILCYYEREEKKKWFLENLPDHPEGAVDKKQNL